MKLSSAVYHCVLLLCRSQWIPHSVLLWAPQCMGACLKAASPAVLSWPTELTRQLCTTATLDFEAHMTHHEDMKAIPAVGPMQCWPAETFIITVHADQLSIIRRNHSRCSRLRNQQHAL